MADDTKDKIEKFEEEVGKKIEKAEAELRADVNEAETAVQNAEELPAPLLKFPCLFPMKIVGTSNPDFAETIVKIIQKYDPSFNAAEVNMKPSAKGNYISLGVAVNATSQDQLDALYQELVDNPMTKFVL